MIKLLNLQLDELTGNRECPVCHELELQENLIWDTTTDESYSTGDWRCDNCEESFSLTKKGILI